MAMFHVYVKLPQSMSTILYFDHYLREQNFDLYTYYQEQRPTLLRKFVMPRSSQVPSARLPLAQFALKLEGKVLTQEHH